VRFIDFNNAWDEVRLAPADVVMYWAEVMEVRRQMGSPLADMSCPSIWGHGDVGVIY